MDELNRAKGRSAIVGEGTDGRSEMTLRIRADCADRSAFEAKGLVGDGLVSASAKGSEDAPPDDTSRRLQLAAIR